MTIVFESHATTADNEAKLAAGWYDGELSETGRRQAAELGRRYTGLIRLWRAHGCANAITVG